MEYKVLPGDVISISALKVTAISKGWASSSDIFETEEGVDVPASVTYEVLTSRPENWPPQDGDVWLIGTHHYHVLDEQFYDVAGVDEGLEEVLSSLGFSAENMSLAFRPGQGKDGK